jgi:glycosyltransferase involved in cell wall biosynthesis
MKKILLVANTSWSMIKFRYGLMQKLVEEQYDVYVISPLDEHSVEIQALGCQHIHIDIDNKGASIFNDIKLTNELYKLYKIVEPDLIFHYTIKPNIYGTLAAKYANIPSIAVITGLGYTFINDNATAKIAKLLYKNSLKHAQKVWFINHDDRRKFILERLIDKNKIDLLPSEGVNTQKFAPLDKDNDDGIFRFILIARILWDKGIGEYVEAAKIIKQKYKNVEFQLAGFLDAQNPKAISKEQVDSWVKNGYINFLGPTNNVKKFIANADCVVLPSYREGISMILLEAASMQKPIITTNVPGCRDIVEHNGSGFLCKPKNVQDLANQMQNLLNLSFEQRLEMGQKSRNYVQKDFDENLVIDKYLQTIHIYLNHYKAQKFILKNSVLNK